MKKTVLLSSFGVTLLIYNFSQAMELKEPDYKEIKAEFNAANLQITRSPNPSVHYLQLVLLCGAEYFTTGNKTVSFKKYLNYHYYVVAAYKQLTSKRANTQKPNTLLLDQFKKKFTESQEGDQEASKQVIQLGSQLLARGGSFGYLHPKIKAAGNILRGKNQK